MKFDKPNGGSGVANPFDPRPNGLEHLTEQQCWALADRYKARQAGERILPSCISTEPVNHDKEPWLRDARREVLPNGRCVIPGPEIDRCWQEWVRRKNREIEPGKPDDPIARRDWAKERQDAEERIESLQDQYRANPITISPELVKRMGYLKREQMEAGE